MSFTTAELNNIANAALDFYLKGPALSQVIQDRPTFDLFEKGKKTFPGGKENISIPVKGVYTTAIAGYTHDDQVTYANPTNIKRVVYPWKEIHAGISFTLTELKVDGISVSDTESFDKTQEHSEREMTVLTGLLEDKLEDMSEGYARTFNSMLWLDGTQDSKMVPGITSILTDDPTTGVIGGIDRSANPWFRHRTLVGANKITTSATLQTLTNTLRSEFRQLRRFGGRPVYAACGSDFLGGLETEVFAKGFLSMTGFAKQGSIDAGVADIELKGVKFCYDPTLDDMGFNKRAYVIDSKHMKLRPMDGEDKKVHNPARPYDRYVMYRAMTWTGGLVADQLNCHGIYEIA